MDFNSWKADIEKLGVEFLATDWGRSVSPLVVKPPPSELDLQNLFAETGLSSQSALGLFYRFADGLAFPDVWNGYFVHEVALVTSQFKDEPASSREEIAFGSDGGGSRFCYRFKDGVITYRAALKSPRVVADDFFDFLQRLQNDVRHYIIGTPGWRFLDAGQQ